MAITNPYASPKKRPHPSPGRGEAFPKRPNCSQPSTQSSDGEEDNAYDASASNGADDPSSFVLDLSQCQEVNKQLSKLSLDDPAPGGAPAEERGDEMQKAAIEHAANGGNLFLTGKAGTGKSWTSRRIRARVQKRGKQMWVVAPTGVAAINVDGATVHSWGGFGLGSHYSNFDAMMAKDNRKKIRDTDILLFDEISMCSGHLFDVLECMVAIIKSYDGSVSKRVKAIKKAAPVITEAMGGARDGYQDKEDSIMSSYMLKMRWEDPSKGGLGDLAPWGGMQLICVGDFFQLTPVPNKGRGGSDGGGHLLENEELCEIEYNNIVGSQGTYAFQSRSWHKTNLRTVELTKIHRQSGGDDGLLKLLNAMREGEKPLSLVHSSALAAIKAPIRDNSDGIVPTELHCKNVDVGEVNKKELANLPGEPVAFKSRDKVEFEDYYKDKLAKKHSVEKIKHLPQIWSSVEGITYPHEFHVAKLELDALEKKKKTLIDAREYSELTEIDKQIDALEKMIQDTEKTAKSDNELTLESVANWLKVAKVEGEAGDFFRRISKFAEQLQSDYKAFSHHANERFFSKECRVADNFELKEKSQVMLLFNIDLNAKLANGSRGVVEGFVLTEEYKALAKAVMEKKEKERGNPHSDDRMDCSSEGADVPMTPPVKKREDVQPTASSLKRHIAEIESEVAAIDKEMSDIQDEAKSDSSKEESLHHLITTLEKDVTQALINRLEVAADEITEVERAVAANLEKLPVVKFTEGQIRVIHPQLFKKEFKGCGEAQRWQIPLALAWAISIHKSQGMTIDLLRCNLDGVFAPGQAYVACSRGRSAETMSVENFSEDRIITSDLVKQFYASLKGTAVFKPPTWSAVLEEAKETAKNDAEIKQRMVKQYEAKRCHLCRSECVVYKVKSQGRNHGKWVVQCKVNFDAFRRDKTSERGHYYQFVAHPQYQ